jgi:4-diphosphocytidyl-2-C-methyl-D-erythritol kinase
MLRFLRPMHNALEAPAMELLPVIGEVLAALRATSNCRLARMSGSGATCFGLYEQSDAAEKAAQELQRLHPKWFVKATPLLMGK